MTPEKSPRDWTTWALWLIPWLLLIGVLASLSLLAGCSLLPSWLGGDATLSNPSPDRPDVLTDPIGHVASWVRTLLQWAVIIGIVMLFPRPRSILMPVISWMWRLPRRETTIRQAAKDVALAAPRLVGLVHSRPVKKPVKP